jgi:hypothetical protein
MGDIKITLVFIIEQIPLAEINLLTYVIKKWKKKKITKEKDFILREFKKQNTPTAGNYCWHYGLKCTEQVIFNLLIIGINIFSYNSEILFHFFCARSKEQVRLFRWAWYLKLQVSLK